jgi:hypothetical protein
MFNFNNESSDQEIIPEEISKEWEKEIIHAEVNW